MNIVTPSMGMGSIEARTPTASITDQTALIKRFLNETLRRMVAAGFKPRALHYIDLSDFNNLIVNGHILSRDKIATIDMHNAHTVINNPNKVPLVAVFTDRFKGLHVTNLLKFLETAYANQDPSTANLNDFSTSSNANTIISTELGPSNNRVSFNVSFSENSQNLRISSKNIKSSLNSNTPAAGMSTIDTAEIPTVDPAKLHEKPIRINL